MIFKIFKSGGVEGLIIFLVGFILTLLIFIYFNEFSKFVIKSANL